MKVEWIGVYKILIEEVWCLECMLVIQRYIKVLVNEANKTMGSITNPKAMRVNTKSSKYFECSNYHTQKWCRVIKNMLTSLSY